MVKNGMGRGGNEEARYFKRGGSSTDTRGIWEDSNKATVD